MKLKMLIFVALAFSTVGCSTKYAVTTSDESLNSLTKITDYEDSCIDPYGGDDGKDLFFSVFEKNKYYNIYKKENVLASAMIQKTSGKNYNLSPAVCLATDKIAFSYWGEGNNNSDIYIMSALKGKALTQITDTQQSNESHPCFSSDGKLLVFDKISFRYVNKANLGLLFSFSTVIQYSEIWLKNLETGELTLLGSGFQPTFSPDGHKIAYIKYASDVKSSSIWIMDLDGTTQSQITDAKKGFAFCPRWSPDGRKLVFQLVKKNKKDADIYSIDINGENLKQYTTNKSSDGSPYWSSDNYIYFTSDRGAKKGEFQIWRFKMNDL